jgi:hypothetical protein
VVPAIDGAALAELIGRLGTPASEFVRSWSEVLGDAEHRHQYFKDALSATSDEDASLDYRLRNQCRRPRVASREQEPLPLETYSQQSAKGVLWQHYWDEWIVVLPIADALL